MVYILLGTGFEEAEALVAADVLRRGNIPVSLTGIGGSAVTGSHGITVETDLPVEGAVLAPGDVVLLPGGMGGVASIEGSAPAMALVKQAAEDDGLWLAAICAAPALLARHGLLKGRQAVCYPGMEDELKQGGAVSHPERSVVVDGKVVTGRGPGSAFDFALVLLGLLAGDGAFDAVLSGLHYTQ